MRETTWFSPKWWRLQWGRRHGLPPRQLASQQFDGIRPEAFGNFPQITKPRFEPLEDPSSFIHPGGNLMTANIKARVISTSRNKFEEKSKQMTNQGFGSLRSLINTLSWHLTALTSRHRLVVVADGRLLRSRVHQSWWFWEKRFQEDNFVMNTSSLRTLD